jgi:hypothetical protein
MVDLDATAAALDIGAPGQERALMQDKRTLVYLGALCGQLRETHAELRAHMVGMLSHMALYDPGVALSSVGWLPFEQWPQSLRMCVEHIELHESGAIKKVKFTRRLDVIAMLLALTGDAHQVARAQARTRVIFEQEVG